MNKQQITTSRGDFYTQQSVRSDVKYPPLSARSGQQLFYNPNSKVSDKVIRDQEIEHLQQRLATVIKKYDEAATIIQQQQFEIENLVTNNNLLQQQLEYYRTGETSSRQCLQPICCGQNRPEEVSLKEQLRKRIQSPTQLQMKLQLPTNFSIQEQSKFQEVQQIQQNPQIILTQSNLIVNTDQRKENMTPITSNRSVTQSILREKIEYLKTTFYNNKQQPSTQYTYRESPKSLDTEDIGTLTNVMHIDLQSDPFCKDRESDLNTLSKQFNFQSEEYVCETYLDGSIYEGFKKQQKKQGQGSLYYSDGGFYIGQWKNDQMNGYGSLYYPSGKLAYQGEWTNGQFQGKGMLFNENPQDTKIVNYEKLDSIGECWVSYSGDFVQDKKEGKGVLIFTNGDRFEGKFKANMIDGPGTFKTGKNVISSIWSKNIML